MTISQSKACQRLTAIGIKSQLKYALLDTFQKWKDCSGKEWAIGRMKELKLLYIKLNANESFVPSNWIALDSHGLPKGPLKELFRIRESEDPKGFFRNLSALQVYTEEISTSTTPSQWQKFRSSVEDATPWTKSLDAWANMYWREPILEGSTASVPMFLETNFSSERRAPVWSEDRKRTVTVPENEVDKWFWLALKNPALSLACNSTRAIDCLGPLWEQLKSVPLVHSDRAIMSKLSDIDPGPPSIGKISFIQEPGYKLRAVANPNRIMQWVLEPLKRSMGELLKTEGLGFDCTFNQEHGTNKIQAWLKERKIVHCVDLSDATNNFPLKPQLELMRRYLQPGVTPYIRVFEAASTGPWRVWDPILKEEREIRWTKGQPLGLGPSFFAFAFTHFKFLQDLRRRFGGDFVVLGDDVAITGESLYKGYSNLLAELECPVSMPKCLDSRDVAEFAGKVITRKGVYPQLKFRHVSDRNFVDIAKHLGPRSLGMYRPRQRKVLQMVAELPEDFNGLGWNPNGKPYNVRVRDGLRVLHVLQNEEFTSNLSDVERRRRVFKHALLLGLLQPVSTSAPLDSTRVRKLEDTSMLDVLTNVLKEVNPPSGDPRGLTDLEIMERKLSSLTKEEVKHRLESWQDTSQDGLPSTTPRDETPEDDDGPSM